MAHCDQCEVLFINGTKCHETGCPSKYKDEIRNCRWCGSDFEPETRDQSCCDDSCNRAYHGLPEDEECEIDPDEEFEFDQREEDETVYQQELSRQLQKFR